MYIALRLLRDGAHTTVTTRFPNDAIRRFTAQPDSAQWLHRLRIVGIDLRDPAQVVALADDVASHGPLDIIINNAAQTVRRSAGSYAALVDAESAPLPAGELPDTISFGTTTQAHPNALTASLDGAPVPATMSAADITDLALIAGSATPERISQGIAIDAGGLVPDLAHTNSWVQTVAEVDATELLEVQLCNSTAPFILISRLRPALAASSARRKYVVNVSAMEGVFTRGYKGPGHPHTNMAKAALNMLTRTSAREMFETDGILMTAVDTGWITDERPHYTKIRLAEEGFHAPLDLVDGAARATTRSFAAKQAPTSSAASSRTTNHPTGDRSGPSGAVFSLVFVCWSPTHKEFACMSAHICVPIFLALHRAPESLTSRPASETPSPPTSFPDLRQPLPYRSPHATAGHSPVGAPACPDPPTLLDSDTFRDTSVDTHISI